MIKIHLSRILGEKRIAQRELARKIGARPNDINDLYNEKAEKIKVSILDGICKELNVKVQDVLEYIPDEKNTTGQEGRPSEQATS